MCAAALSLVYRFALNVQAPKDMVVKTKEGSQRVEGQQGTVSLTPTNMGRRKHVNEHHPRPNLSVVVTRPSPVPIAILVTIVVSRLSPIPFAAPARIVVALLSSMSILW